jgi:hypothetical protein
MANQSLTELRVFGTDPFASSAGAAPVGAAIGDLFLAHNVLVWGQTTHMHLALTFQEQYNALAREQGWKIMTDAEVTDYLALFYLNGNIEIRADAERLDDFFQADSLLQQHFGQRMTPRIRLLGATSHQIHDAIRDRGLLWRIARKSHKETDIRADIKLAQRKPLTVDLEFPLYYYNKVSGTRFVTCDSFCRLGGLPDPVLASILQELAEYSVKYNGNQAREVAFFAADSRFGAEAFYGIDFRTLDSPTLRATYQGLVQQYKTHLTDKRLAIDDIKSGLWRSQMYATLTTRPGEEVVDEEQMLGLAPEFFWKVRWLPGGIITPEGIFLPDPVIRAIKEYKDDAQLQALGSDVVPGIINNHLRRLGTHLESINVGRLTEPLADPDPKHGRREGYVVVVKEHGAPQPVIKTVHMLRWGTLQYLADGKSLQTSMVDIYKFNTEALDYMEFVKDRENGFKQLGGQLVNYELDTVHERFQGYDFSSFYLERNYVHGTATQNLPGELFRDPAFALDFFKRYGQTIVVPDLCVGRVDEHHRVLIDSGNEVCLIAGNATIKDIVVVDVIGVFHDYESPLTRWGLEYARPVNKRLEFLQNPVEIGQVYLDAILEGFTRLKTRIADNRMAYWDYMFRNRPEAEKAFKWLWHAILDRILSTHPEELRASIAKHLPH